MNYDDPSQQHYYMQRIPPQQQRMAFSMGQQQHNQSGMHQQPPQQMRQPFNMAHQPQQIMVRMPVMGDDPNVQHFPQQQQPSQHLREMLQSLPPNIQNQIANERDPERKKQIFNAAWIQHKQMFEQMQQQGGMGMRLPMNVVQQQRLPISQGGGNVYPGQQVVMQQPTQIQRIPSQGSFGQSPGQPAQMYNMPINQMGQTVRGAAIHPLPINQPYLQQQFQPQPQQTHQMSNKQHLSNTAIIAQQQQHSQITPSNSVESNIGLETGRSSSQIIHHLNSVSHPPISEDHSIIPVVVDNMTGIRPQNTPEQQLPRTARTPLSVNSQHHQQQQNETENPEYKRLLEHLRTYRTDVKRLLEHLNIDKPGEMKLKSSLINVIQVMEGTRKGGPVNRDLLKKLLSNVQTVLEQYNIARHFLVAARKLKAAHFSGKEMPKEPLFLDPWKDVRHLQIKVPDEILKKKSETIKRSFGGNSSNQKKEENNEPLLKRGLLESMAESFSTPEQVESTFKIDCIDGSELILNSILSMALGRAVQQGFKVDFDSDHIPISSNCPSLHVRFSRNNEKKLTINISTSLCLLLPTNYPKSQIKILTEPQGSKAMDILLEKIDSNLVNTNSLDCILVEWINCF